MVVPYVSRLRSATTPSIRLRPRSRFEPPGAPPGAPGASPAPAFPEIDGPTRRNPDRTESGGDTVGIAAVPEIEGRAAPRPAGADPAPKAPPDRFPAGPAEHEVAARDAAGRSLHRAAAPPADNALPRRAPAIENASEPGAPGPPATVHDEALQSMEDEREPATRSPLAPAPRADGNAPARSGPGGTAIVGLPPRPAPGSTGRSESGTEPRTDSPPEDRPEDRVEGRTDVAPAGRIAGDARGRSPASVVPASGAQPAASAPRGPAVPDGPVVPDDSRPGTNRPAPVSRRGRPPSGTPVEVPLPPPSHASPRAPVRTAAGPASPPVATEVLSIPLPVDTAPAPTGSPAGSLPHVHVSIGRIEVGVEPVPPRRAARPDPREHSTTSLADYLRARTSGQLG